MGTPTARNKERDQVHATLVRIIEHHARRAEEWRRAVHRVLIIWALAFVALTIWNSIAGGFGLSSFLIRGSPVVFFGVWFAWCRSNHAKHERMQNVWATLQVCLNEAKTPNARNELLRDIEKAMVKINSGEEKSGVEVLPEKRGVGEMNNEDFPAS